MLCICTLIGSNRLGKSIRMAMQKVATVLGSIPESSETLESEGRQMKQCWIKYFKIPQKTSLARLNPLCSNSRVLLPSLWWQLQAAPPRPPSSSNPSPRYPTQNPVWTFRLKWQLNTRFMREPGALRGVIDVTKDSVSNKTHWPMPFSAQLGLWLILSMYARKDLLLTDLWSRAAVVI